MSTPEEQRFLLQLRFEYFNMIIGSIISERRRQQFAKRATMSEIANEAKARQLADDLRIRYPEDDMLYIKDFRNKGRN